jgi:hypothetical protein
MLQDGTRKQKIQPDDDARADAAAAFLRWRRAARDLELRVGAGEPGGTEIAVVAEGAGAADELKGTGTCDAGRDGAAIKEGDRFSFLDAGPFGGAFGRIGLGCGILQGAELASVDVLAGPDLDNASPDLDDTGLALGPPGLRLASTVASGWVTSNLSDPSNLADSSTWAPSPTGSISTPFGGGADTRRIVPSPSGDPKPGGSLLASKRRPERGRRKSVGLLVSGGDASVAASWHEALLSLSASHGRPGVSGRPSQGISSASATAVAPAGGDSWAQHLRAGSRSWGAMRTWRPASDSAESELGPNACVAAECVGADGAVATTDSDVDSVQSRRPRYLLAISPIERRE